MEAASCEGPSWLVGCTLRYEYDGSDYGSTVHSCYRRQDYLCLDDELMKYWNRKMGRHSHNPYSYLLLVLVPRVAVILMWRLRVSQPCYRANRALYAYMASHVARLCRSAISTSAQDGYLTGGVGYGIWYRISGPGLVEFARRIDCHRLAAAANHLATVNPLTL